MSSSRTTTCAPSSAAARLSSLSSTACTVSSTRCAAINVERACTRAAAILVHDCYPLDARTAQREQQTRFWSGDIWRLLLLLREQRPDLTVRTIGTPPTGLGMVLNPDPRSHVLGERCEALIAEYLGKDFQVLAGRQAEALGLVPNDWPAIRALLDARAHS